MPNPVTGVTAGASLLGGAMSSSAASSAASAQADAATQAGELQAQSARESLDFQRQMYDQQRADIAPYRQAGLTAQNRLLTYLGLAPTADAMAPPTQFDQTGYDRAMDNYYRQMEQFNAASRAGGGNLSPTENFYSTVNDVGPGAALRNMLSGALGGGGAVAGGGAGGTFDMPMPTREQFTSTMPVDQINVDPNAADFGKYARDFSMADFEADPGYAFRLSEGMKALDRQAAARGGLISGAALRGAQRFGQDLGSQEYGRAFDRYQINRANQLDPLMSISGYGQTATNTLGGYGSNLAANTADIMAAGSAAQANALGAAGQARASGYVGQSNALNSMLGNLSDVAGQYYANQPSNTFLGGTSSMGTRVPTTYGAVGSSGSFGGL